MSQSLTFRVTIDTTNSGFECNSEPPCDAMQACDGRNQETARILRRIADRLDAGEAFSVYETLRDSNGNDVGRAAFKPTENPQQPTRGRRVKPSRPLF